MGFASADAQRHWKAFGFAGAAGMGGNFGWPVLICNLSFGLLEAPSTGGNAMCRLCGSKALVASLNLRFAYLHQGRGFL